MSIRVIDFETSSLAADAAVCEAGWCDLTRNDLGEIEIGEPVSVLVNPGRPITPEASAIHHITNAVVAGAPLLEHVEPQLRGDGFGAYSAHNVSFEENFFDVAGRPWLCTYKAALRLWPDAPAHKLQVLRYWLDLDSEPDFKSEFASPPHRARADAYVGAFVLRRLLAAATATDVGRWTREPYMLPRVTFGKHKGLRWHEVPDGYIQWLVTRATDLAEDVLDTARHHAQQRGII